MTTKIRMEFYNTNVTLLGLAAAALADIGCTNYWASKFSNPKRYEGELLDALLEALSKLLDHDKCPLSKKQVEALRNGEAVHLTFQEIQKFEIPVGLLRKQDLLIKKYFG